MSVEAITPVDAFPATFYRPTSNSPATTTTQMDVCLQGTANALTSLQTHTLQDTGEKATNTATYNLSGAGKIEAAGSGAITLKHASAIACDSGAGGTIRNLTVPDTLVLTGCTVSGNHTSQGTITREGRETKSGSDAQTAWRWSALTDANGNIDVSKDIYKIPDTLTANRVYTICHSGVSSTKVPTAGQVVRVYRSNGAGVSAHAPKIERENGDDLWIWGNGYMGHVDLIFDGTSWDVLGGAIVDGAALTGTGWYGN